MRGPFPERISIALGSSRVACRPPCFAARCCRPEIAPPRRILPGSGGLESSLCGRTGPSGAWCRQKNLAAEAKITATWRHRPTPQVRAPRAAPGSRLRCTRRGAPRPIWPSGIAGDETAAGPGRGPFSAWPNAASAAIRRRWPIAWHWRPSRPIPTTKGRSTCSATRNTRTSGTPM